MHSAAVGRGGRSATTRDFIASAEVWQWLRLPLRFGPIADPADALTQLLELGEAAVGRLPIAEPDIDLRVRLKAKRRRASVRVFLQRAGHPDLVAPAACACENVDSPALV
jgi:hypothetical protein